MPVPRGPGFQPFRRFAPVVRPKDARVFAVGGRAIVTCPGDARVVLTDEGGANSLSAVGDGVEVEVLAWRPRPGATRYHVISADRQHQGWVAASSLKAHPPRSLPKLVVTGKPAIPLPSPVRGARGTGPRTRSARALNDGATIKIITRTAKNTRIGTR